MDLEIFFDSKVLVDVLGEAYRNLIPMKTYKLLYKMNQKRKISVVTPVGESKEEDVDEGLGQGGLDSAILSSASVSNGLEDFFRSSQHEAWYGEIRLQPCSYQDDVMRISKNIEDTKVSIR